MNWSQSSQNVKREDVSDNDDYIRGTFNYNDIIQDPIEHNKVPIKNNCIKQANNYKKTRIVYLDTLKSRYNTTNPEKIKKIQKEKLCARKKIAEYIN